MKVLAPARYAQTLVELVHQPGLAAPDRAPEVEALGGAALLEGLEAGLQGLDDAGLGGVSDVAPSAQGVLVEGLGVDGHGRILPDCHPSVQARVSRPGRP
ncbi:hypothetical protein D9M73_287720 [compost metagenome]